MNNKIISIYEKKLSEINQLSQTRKLILTDRKHLDNNPKIVTKDDIIQILKAINELE